MERLFFSIYGETERNEKRVRERKGERRRERKGDGDKETEREREQRHAQKMSMPGEANIRRGGGRSFCLCFRSRVRDLKQRQTASHRHTLPAFLAIHQTT